MHKHLRNAICFILILLLASSIGYCSKRMKRAKEMVELGMYEEAIALLKKEVFENPKNAEAHFLLGKVYLHIGNEKNAQVSFDRAIKAKPGFKTKMANEYKELGVKLLEQRRPERAKEKFDRAVNFNSETREAIAEILISHGEKLAESDFINSFKCFGLAIMYSESHKNKVGVLCLNIAENLLDKEKIDVASGFESIARECLGDKFEKEGQGYLKKLKKKVREIKPSKSSKVLERERLKQTREDMVKIATAIADYITDNGKVPAQNGIYSKNSGFYNSLSPLYIKNLPISDLWGNNYRVYCGEDCNGIYGGIAGCSSDDFIIVSYGRDGKEEDWEFDSSKHREAGFYVIKAFGDYDKDLVIWNDSWIRAPRSAYFDRKIKASKFRVKSAVK